METKTENILEGITGVLTIFFAISMLIGSSAFSYYPSSPGWYGLLDNIGTLAKLVLLFLAPGLFLWKLKMKKLSAAEVIITIMVILSFFRIIASSVIFVSMGFITFIPGIILILQAINFLGVDDRIEKKV